MKQKLVLVRGLPGAGKSTIAGESAIEADQYFCQNPEGEYRFDPKKLKDAHTWCQNQVFIALELGQSVVWVANTFTQRWEMQPYIEMAESYGVDLVVRDIFDGGQTDEALAKRNVHGVPLEAIQRMRARYEKDWANGNPRPPWDR